MPLLTTLIGSKLAISIIFIRLLSRSGDAVISTNTLVTSYCAATGGALATALGLNSLGLPNFVRKLNTGLLPVRSLPALVGRLVPFVACSAANCINIPLMRRLEITEVIRIKKINEVDIQLYFNGREPQWRLQMVKELALVK